MLGAETEGLANIGFDARLTRKISINRCTRSGGRQGRRCTLFVLSAVTGGEGEREREKKEVKINYFVVDARTERGIDRSLDRIKSRARRLPFSRSLSFFIFVTAIPTHRILFPCPVDETQRKMITPFVATPRDARGKSISPRSESSLFECTQRKKDLISTLKKESRFEDPRESTNPRRIILRNLIGFAVLKERLETRF